MKFLEKKPGHSLAIFLSVRNENPITSNHPISEWFTCNAPSYRRDVLELYAVRADSNRGKGSCYQLAGRNVVSTNLDQKGHFNISEGSVGRPQSWNSLRHFTVGNYIDDGKIGKGITMRRVEQVTQGGHDKKLVSKGSLHLDTSVQICHGKPRFPRPSVPGHANPGTPPCCASRGLNWIGNMRPFNPLFIYLEHQSSPVSVGASNERQRIDEGTFRVIEIIPEDIRGLDILGSQCISLAHSELSNITEIIRELDRNQLEYTEHSITLYLRLSELRAVVALSVAEQPKVNPFGTEELAAVIHSWYE
ncbi:hypothetical protein WN48_09073 [Eufriesea mexicana]|uniref:Uncharacterized protein n=1 Tax=Eufriesea mexicana TaxID=516756 RepID=A0A310SHP6_9HYME|nr:hypothetical protein WN48_09073 [Eufriesea mexicana]